MSEIIEKHSRMPRKAVLATGEPQPRTDLGQFTEIDQERKKACLDDVKPMLFQGFTLLQIAQKHQISSRTLDFWLAQMGDEYQEIRKQWLDFKLSEARDTIENAPDPFQLAKGREMMRFSQWTAERRDPMRYADKRELTVKQGDPESPEAIRSKIEELEKRLGVRTIDQESQ